MITLPLPLAGGCQCGRRRFRLVEAPIAFYACHCTECRRQSASAFGLSVLAPRAALQLDPDDLATYARPGANGEVEGRFCPDCGARLVHFNSGRPQIAVIKGGALDAADRLEPAGHIWVDSALPWMRALIPADGLRYRRAPPDLDVLAARFAERHRFEG